jgi:hypothetical protein
MIWLVLVLYISCMVFLCLLDHSQSTLKQKERTLTQHKEAMTQYKEVIEQQTASMQEMIHSYNKKVYGNRPVEELRNTRVGYTAVVVGSGATLDYYKQNWSPHVNYIIIGVNQVWQHVPCDYVVQKDPKYRTETMRWCKQNNAKLICSLFDYGGNGLPSIPGDYYTFFHVYNNGVEINMTPMIERWNNTLSVSWSTLTSAISLAAFLGCKQCILVGCDMGLLDGASNATAYMNHNANTTAYHEWIQNDRLVEHVRICADTLLEHYGMITLWSHPFSSLQELIEHT